MTSLLSELLLRISGPKLTYIDQDIRTRHTTLRRRRLDRNRTEQE